MKIFISKSDKDQAIYLTLCLALKAKFPDDSYVDHFDSLSMIAGGSLSGQLKKAIAECQLCIFIATRRSIKSRWCLAELGAFWGAEKPVVLFMVDPDLDESVLPPQFEGNSRARNPVELFSAIEAKRLEIGLQKKIALDGLTKKIWTREEMYLLSCDLIKSSRTIRDTTWGRKPTKELRKEEEIARAKYRKAIETFMEEEKDYYELLTAEKRDNYIMEALIIKKKYSNYQCKVLQTDISNLPILDMMIADQDKVLFSHVSSQGLMPVVQYLYIESEVVAGLFLGLYSDAWHISVNILDHIENAKIQGLRSDGTIDPDSTDKDM